MKPLRGMLAGAIVAAALTLTGCVATSVFYDPNVYHTGKTVGKKKTAVQFAGAMAQEIRNDDSDYFETESHDKCLVVHAGMSHGLSERFDLGGTASLGFVTSGPSAGIRVFGKAMLTKPGDRVAVSLMPAISYINGSTDTDPELHRDASSHLFTLELHVPISIQTADKFSIILDPQTIYFMHDADLDTEPGDVVFSNSVENRWICPGMGFGVQAGPVLPEVSLFYIDDNLRLIGGVAVNL